MRRTLIALAVVAGSMLPVVVVPADDAAATATDPTPASTSSALPATHDRYVAVTTSPDGTPGFESFEARSPMGIVEKVAEIAEAGADLVSVVPDSRVSVAAETVRAATDPLRTAQWALDRVTFERSWPASDGTGVVVAVVDTGVDASHEDLAGAVLPGWDFTVTNRAGVAGGTTDPSGHGTHVAGIIAARRDNDLGGVGVAPGAKILPVRVLDAGSGGWASDIANGIKWAARNGADVVNLSLGGTEGAEIYAEAVAYARTRGVVVVAAAGNEAGGGNPVVYPAAIPAVVAVAAVDAYGARAAFSSYGHWVDVAAPGTNILAPCPASAASCGRTPSSSVPAGYSRRSGTSMAAPHVSAAAALLLGANPSLRPDQVESALLATADDIGAPGVDVEFGAGLIDPTEALAGFHPGAGTGYWIFGRDGRVASVGAAARSILGGVTSASPVVAAAATPSGSGYWIVTEDGAVSARGDAVHRGDASSVRLNAPIVGMTATPGGGGYWLLAGDGGVFAYGDAGYHGSTGDIVLNHPVVDMTVTPSGGGYWLVASDGGVFTFGDAGYHGSTGDIVLNEPVTSIAAGPAGPSGGGGYWLVARDGGIFTFGVPFHGSLPGLRSSDPSVPGGSRIRATTGGYYILGTDGRVFPFAGARALGEIPADFRAGFEAVDLVLVPDQRI